MPKIDMVGQKFGRLTVMSFSPRPGKNPYWLCLCTCGKETIVRAECLRKGSIQSCGCYAKEIRPINATKHNMSGIPEYIHWANMLRRCNNPKLKSYPSYGGRGIKVCERWLSLPHFLADMGKMPNRKATIERFNTDGDFEPSNCRWGQLKKKKIKPILRHFPDITGQTFGLLTAISLFEKKDNSNAPRWLFKCACGNHCIKSYSDVAHIKSQQSCGCPIKLNKAKSMKHGMSNSAEFRAWSNIKERCYNPKNQHFRYYGAKGIAMCNSWKEGFINFFNDMGFRPSNNHTIERLNVNGNYEPSNCIWLHKYDQASNKTNNHVIEYEGKRLHLAAWCRELGVKDYQIKYLLHDKKLTFPEAVAELRRLGKCKY